MCMNLMSSEPSWIQRASNALWLAILMSLRQLDVIIQLPATFKFDEQNFWHSPIDSSSKAFVSLNKFQITMWILKSLTHRQLLHHIVCLI
jgi:hypothetical protein